MSALMADHRDYADEARQPSLFDVLAPPSAPPGSDDTAEQFEGGRVVEFRRRSEVPGEPEAGVVQVAEPEVSVEAPTAYVERRAEAAPTGYLEPAPAAKPEDAWLTEIAPDLDEAELTMLAPTAPPVETDSVPEVDVAEEPRTQRAAGLPLAGPTLDDVVSRVWEGLVMGLPAACPACHAEVLPAHDGARSGQCTSCGTTIE